ncbi:glutathione peroxidase [Bacillus sp. APMAM]|uniref:glutathione peroxidase n=1 Tax=Margalitia sp. FSL K6-0131 TaxID=2954604 RepID=UPI000F85D43D|nr:glutathione peroxidase [Bacillus sp. APMAM]RTZ57563.1 glutathione peroxidase [Bacillus sp. SAJ1]
MSFYSHSARLINGEEVSMTNYKNKVLLIVNTASKCGFTKQFKDLETLYQKYKSKEFEILGFPCNQFGEQDPGSNEEIAQFCTLNYNVSFPMFEKIEVNGENAHPIYQYLTSHAAGFLGTKKIKWNFTKFLINRQGEVVARYAPNINPLKIEKDIEKYLTPIN